MQYQANVGQNFLAIVLRLVQIFNKYLTNLHENLFQNPKNIFLLRQYDMLLCNRTTSRVTKVTCVTFIIRSLSRSTNKIT